MALEQIMDALVRMKVGQKSVALVVALVLVLVSSGLAHASVVDHMVRSGESLWLLSMRHRTTVASIQQLNRLSGTTIYPDQNLRIPADSRVHVVSRGETLGEIAQWYRAEVGAIKSASATSSLIHPGQQLVVPMTTSAEAGAQGAAVTASASVPFSDGDTDLLARLVQSEAGGEPYAGKVAVAAVVLNRVRSESFPNTVRGVIYQPMQFCPVDNGTIYQPADAESFRAVRDAMNGSDPSLGALYFFAPSKTSNAFVWSRPVTLDIANHRFAR